jgi:hypothetical protein
MIKTNIYGCARCDGEGHNNIVFCRFDRPAGTNGEYTHWATCPTTGEPILMKFVKLEDVSKTLIITEEDYDKWMEEARYSAGMSGAWSNFAGAVTHHIGWKVKEFFEGEDDDE